MGASERLKQAERHPSPEIIMFPPEHIGLQARLLIGGNALNPDNNNLPLVTSEALGNFENRDYTLFNNASTQERSRFWQGKEDNDFDRQKRKWIDDTLTTFQDAQEFFRNSDQGKKWSQVYTRIGIDTQNVTSSSIEVFYDKYFIGETKQSDIKKFVGDIVSSYKRTDNTVDETALKENLAGIQWISNIFGATSAEIITQLVDAEVKLQTQPQNFVNQANEQQTINNIQVSRINRLDDEEKRLLRFLWTSEEEVIEPAPPVYPTKPQGYKIHYQRLDKPVNPADPASRKIRTFPGTEEEIRKFVHPYSIAQSLKINYSQVYGNYDTDTLAQEIIQEQNNFNHWMEKIDLHPQAYATLINKNLEHYEKFLKDTYGVETPRIENLRVIPLHGKMAQLYNPTRKPLAFVTSKYPIIFLDFDVVLHDAILLKRNSLEGLTPEEQNRIIQNLTPKEINEFITRLLLEIHPHEYTHLVADMANWHLDKQLTDGSEIKDVETGKHGLALAKPVPPKISPEEQLIMKGRGVGLNEAITVELTNQWAKSFNKKLDIQAYAEERHVFHSLIAKIANEEGLSEEDVFKKFVKGYFSSKGYKDLAEFLSGKKVEVFDEKHKDGKNKVKITFKRPHYLQSLYAVMQYEWEKAAANQQPLSYPLTLAYIEGNFNEEQKSELGMFLQSIAGKEILLSPSAKKHLLNNILSLPSPENPPPPKLSSTQVAEQLLDYSTGEPKTVKIDLKPYFSQLVDKVKERMKDDDTLFPPHSMPLVLSNVAYAMINRIAQEANKKNSTLDFSLRGVLLTTGTGEEDHKNALVAAFASPRSRYDKASYDTEENNTKVLAQNTNLEEDLKDIVVDDCRVFYDALGEKYTNDPSEELNRMARKMENENLIQYAWGIVSKSEEELYIRVWITQRVDENVTHKEIPVILEEQIGS